MADRTVILAIHLLEALHASEKSALLDAAGTEREFLALSRGEVERIVGRALKMRSFSPDRLLRAAWTDLKYLTQEKIAYTFYWDRDYPPLLREIYDPPFVLFFRGRLPDPSQPLVAVVGTRHPTGRGLRAAFQLGAELGSRGVPVVSGLARGVDAAAHRGNIHGGGRTVAVLGSGIDRVYPSDNVRLAESIIETGGLICSEFAPGVPPLKHHFPGRNRIISGLSRSVVVTEAPAGSGALITADFCLDQGRDLCVHRSGIQGPNSGGCAELASNGAMLVSGAADVIEGWGDTTFAGEQAPGVDGSEHGRDVIAGELPVDRLERRPSYVERNTGIELADLMRQELEGTVKTYYGAYFRRSDRWQTRRFTPC